MQTIRRGASLGWLSHWYLIFFLIVSHDDVDTNDGCRVADLKNRVLLRRRITNDVVHDVIIAILARCATIQGSLVKSTTSSKRREERWRDCNLDRQDLTVVREDDRGTSSILIWDSPHAYGMRKINSTDVTSRTDTIVLPARVCREASPLASHASSPREAFPRYGQGYGSLSGDADSPLPDILSHRISNRLFIYLSQCEIHEILL